MIKKYKNFFQFYIANFSIFRKINVSCILSVCSKANVGHSLDVFKHNSVFIDIGQYLLVCNRVDIVTSLT